MATTKPVTVLLADPNDLTRPGLESLLSNDARFRVVGEASAEPEGAARQLQPDLIVVDPARGSALDLQVVDALHNAAPSAPVVILTSAFLLQPIMSAIQKHVYGYFRKEFALSGERFLEALVPIARSHVASVDPLIAELFQSSMGTTIQFHEAGESGGELTPREREVLLLALQEATDKAIAARLQVKPSTVEYHVDQARQKLGALNRLHLGWLLHERGLP